ncbi:MAG: methyltransferase [Treponema sp.]|jgi:23S rRNA (uracil1939-C5)-methyltransferase|nr:methyltransferase [Treponema sp.]
MAAGDIYKLELLGIASGGEALARIRGKPVFVEGGAPCEKAVCRINEEHKSWARAEILEIIEASPVRTSAACVYYGKCGGCNLQHIDYNAQLEAKAAILTESFVKIGGFAPPMPEIHPSPPWEYRNRMQFHCFREQKHDENKKFGVKGRRSGEIIPVSDCPIADPKIRELLQNNTPVSFPPEKDRFTVYARNELLINEGGVQRGKISFLGREITLDAQVFFQSNGTMLEKLISDLQKITAGAGKNMPMADLYAGVGTFAFFLFDKHEFTKADIVEENKTALSLARENMRGKNADFFAMRDSDWVKNVRNKPAYGFVIADPPRSGLAPTLTAWLAESGTPMLTYVSCDPASLARDSKILINGGYKLEKLALYDFYPQTAHIETLSVFTRAC